MTLAEFLRERIAEDEAAATSGDCRCGDVQRPDCADRILAECEAKRRIVDLHEGEHVCEHTYDGVSYAAADTRDPLHVIDGVPEYRESCQTMRLLALPYADHSDYRPEWRP